MSPKPTYEELEKKAARLEKALARCRQTEKSLKKCLGENKGDILQVMFDASHDNLLLLDLDGTVLAINTTAARGLKK